ncbi:MAG TPA: pyrimidine dimer DNA glycosylase/endonuclease V [Anaerolineaceae bacterium]|nr:pyrimidine dimer DNA glycosylase/endonuclease V [Anaerolineaceae bacterium]
MRLWSLHPKYLDAKGLTAVWREGLLAQAVLRGSTRGYRFHPQLVRFKHQPDPVAAIAAYLQGVLEEAERRNYHFAHEKIEPARKSSPIAVTLGQLMFEWERLLVKLAARDPLRLERQREISQPDPHPLFTVVEGEIEPWERGAAGR